jgi:hypothetical protein
MPNLVAGLVGNHMLVVIGVGNPTDEEWAASEKVAVAALARVGGDVSRTATLIFSEGGGPNAKQRGRSREVYKDSPPRLALITDSMLARGVAAIFQIFWSDKLRVYSSSDWRDGLDFLHFPPEQIPELLATLKTLEAQIGSSLRVCAPALQSEQSAAPQPKL